MDCSPVAINKRRNHTDEEFSMVISASNAEVTVLRDQILDVKLLSYCFRDHQNFKIEISYYFLANCKRYSLFITVYNIYFSLRIHDI